MVAHRLDSLLNVDRVVVLDGGRIVEDGCPMTLLAEKTSFFAKQFCGEPRDL
jgi:ABC-type multidrug transport system fused ATPase/permease subunit